MFDSVLIALLPFFNNTVDDEDQEVLKKKLEDAHVKIQKYGYNNEVSLFRGFVKALNNKDLDTINNTLPSLSEMLRVIRKELDYPKKEVKLPFRE